MKDLESNHTLRNYYIKHFIFTQFSLWSTLLSWNPKQYPEGGNLSKLIS